MFCEQIKSKDFHKNNEHFELLEAIFDVRPPVMCHNCHACCSSFEIIVEDNRIKVVSEA